MQQDREKWNKKYSQTTYPLHPSQIVKKYHPMVSKGKTLDIAAGNGRNAVYLARKGFSVDAVDISDVGLRQFSGKHPNIHPICVDLDHFEIRPSHYNLILNIKFLNRRLFPYIREGLAPGGILIFESFLEMPGEDSTGQPFCRDYLLRDNELLHAFLSLRILFYQEKTVQGQNESRSVASLIGLKHR
jgi:SAM-dependent methyltransferase